MICACQHCKLQRVGHAHIVDLALAFNFKGHELKQINRCRMHLGIVTVADMATAAGTHIAHAARQGDRAGVPTKNAHHSVHQKKPDQKSWRLWTRFGSKISKKGKLFNPLGDWTTPVARLRGQHITWQVPNDDLLYVADSTGTFYVHKQLHFDYGGDPHLSEQPLPALTVPADVTTRPQTLQVHPNRHCEC